MELNKAVGQASLPDLIHITPDGALD